MKWISCVLIILFLFTGCSEDECFPPELPENIIGSWSYNLLGNSGEAEFQSDGTLIDPEGVIIEAEINGVILDEKSWTATETVLTVKAEKESQFVTYDYTVTKNECDVITLNVLGINVDLKRE